MRIVNQRQDETEARVDETNKRLDQVHKIVEEKDDFGAGQSK